MNDITEFLKTEIERAGPIPFRRFMEVALYHPEWGYYRRGRDPFGKQGDFYTAQQVQPVFGLLIRQMAAVWERKMGLGGEFTVVELGPGRGELAEYLGTWNYVAVEVDRGQIPNRFQGLVIANEFFDALPVDAVIRRGGRYRLLRVGWDGARFGWREGEPVAGELNQYLERFGGEAREGERREVNLTASEVLRDLASRMTRGVLVAIDYGYTTPELVRFPEGTLMSYRRHRALDDVLAEPGDRDITAHVPFTAMEEMAARWGWRRAGFESLTRFVLRLGEQDQFQAVLTAADERDQLKRRLQLKELLFGMGETFRVMILERNERETSNEKGPDGSGPG